jgi:hypothetical protein
VKLPPHLLTVDFETYWSTDFTLKKLSIEKYVRDGKFLVHGAAVKYGDSPARWVTAKDLPAFFAQVPWDRVALLCQNAPFDALILSHHYGCVPAMYLCTLAMARMLLPRQRHNLDALARHYEVQVAAKGNVLVSTKGLRELPPGLERELGDMSCRDADKTYGVFRAEMAEFPLGELEIIDTTIRMFVTPTLTLDRKRARSLLARVIRNKRSALHRLGVTEKQVSSTNQFADLLLDRFGIETPMKLGKRAPDGTLRWIPALAKTDPFLKSLLEHENPDVQALAAVRLRVKSTLEETRLYRLLDMHERGPLPVYLNFAGTHTFRWSGGDKMNWQNFPRGSELRKCITAPPGHVIVVADLSQIEARMLNCLAGQWDMVKAFLDGDPYCDMATDVYGRVIIKKLNPLERHLGKVLILGCGYGMGAAKLRGTLRVGALGGPPMIVDMETAQLYINKYRGKHKKVVEYWGQAETALQLLGARVKNYPWGPMVIHDGKIILPNGAAMDYTGLCRENGEWRMRDRNGALTFNQFGQPIRLYGPLLAENVTQALSRVVLSQAMPAIRARFPIVMSTHDELACLARKEEADECLKHMLDTMTKRPSWLPMIPLAAEGGYDACYSK